MHYEFDQQGLYVGPRDTASNYTTDVAPPPAGNGLWPLWNHREWVMAPQPLRWSDPGLPPEYWWIDTGPFKDRLGADAPAIGGSDHRACRAVVSMLEGRQYVDLREGKVLAMLTALIATEQPAADVMWPGSGPMTRAKRDAILGRPTTEDERHVKGLPQPV